MRLYVRLSAFAFLILTLLAACDTPYKPPTDEERAARKAAYEAKQLIEGNALLAECQATRCERLDLDGKRLSDFTVLNAMPYVKALMVSRTNFDDLGDISEMTQLQELHISRTDISDLSGLAVFSNLDVLHMEYLRNDPSIAPLSSPALRGLVELALKTDKDDSIAFLANMKSLKRLKFGRGEVGTLKPLSGHPSLERLSSDADILQWQRGLLRLPRLKEFYEGHGMQNLDSGIRDALDKKGLLTVQPAIIVC